MNKTTGKLTVFFENPFWIGVFERIENGKLSVCKITFGSEPKDYDVYNFILKKYYDLKFSPDVKTIITIKEKKINPKRIRREIKRQLEHANIGTKSQQALKLQHEKTKTERKAISREMKEAEKQRQFDLKQQKRKNKYKGR